MQGIVSVGATLKPPKPPKATAAGKLKITVTKVANGYHAHHQTDGAKPQLFVFPNTDKLVKHLAHTARAVWEGNKTGTPRKRGSMKAHREKQLETSGY